MSSSKWIRIACISAAAFALGTAAITSVSAQDATQEATQDTSMMMSQMTAMDGACQPGWAETMLNNQMGMSTQTPAMGATQDMSGTNMATMEATTDTTGTSGTSGTSLATMEATNDTTGTNGTTGATGTEEAMGVKCLFGQFSGTAEVPGPGDTDASGFVFVSVDPSSGNICYEIAIANITLPAVATHIHVNSIGVSGPVVVPFPVPPDAEGKASGCANANVEGLAQTIASKPEQYYVNVHTTDFPDGAARAQLSDWSTSSMNTGMSGMMGTMEPGMTGTMEPGMTSTQDMSGSTMVTPEATTSG